MPTFRATAMLCALWLWLLSPCAHACGLNSNSAGSEGLPELHHNNINVSICAPTGANSNCVLLESSLSAELQNPQESCWEVLLETRTHEVKVGTELTSELVALELSDASNTASAAAGFVHSCPAS